MKTPYLKKMIRPSALTAMALAAAIVALVLGCGGDAGTDAISSRKAPPPGEFSGDGCTSCHLSPDTPALNPLSSNGTGTDGKHVVHYSMKGIGCEECHLGYFDSGSHFNGTFDTGNLAVSMVSFDAVSPAGRWTNDTGPKTGSCSSVACHGPDTMDWYGTAPWTLPSCEACHLSLDYPGIDPLETNASGTAGKHVIHYSMKGIGCEDCHVDYSASATHMNGTLNTGDPAVALVLFDGLNASGQWLDDTGPQTGSCSTVACHGPDTMGWYGTTQWSPPVCEACHQSTQYPAINPLLTSGSWTAGKHTAHYGTWGIGCEKCHAGYSSSATHMNGTLNTGDPAAAIVQFDGLNATGQWVDDTGAQSGSCSSVACHGPDTMGWYGTAQWNPPACEACHLWSAYAAINPLQTGGSGTAGKHTVHYGSRGFACEECHQGYSSISTHANGTLDASDPAVAIVFFDATNPAGAWTGDTGLGTGQCANMDCHGPDILEWYGTDGWTPPACPVCHSSPLGSRRTITGPEGDFEENPSMASHHVMETDDPNEGQCVICHDQSRHMSGSVRLIEADTGEVIVYDPANAAGIEPFCLSCHDEDYANGNNDPFGDGKTLGVAPYRMSAEIKSRWERTYGHRRLGLTCLGTGEPGTGCHAGGHGSPHAGILARRLALPNLAPGPYEVGDEVNYVLCFSCHENYPRVTKEAILGVKQGGHYDNDLAWGVFPPYFVPAIMTTFRDRNENSPKLYDDRPWWGGSWNNLHFFHLELSAWRYRGTYYNSGVNCITCHDMHGSDTQWGWVYDEIQLRHYAGVENDEYAVMEHLYNDVDAMSYYPVGCSFNCHAVLTPVSHMWFEPPNE